MLTLTNPDGAAITGTNDVHLAALCLDHQHGEAWEDGLIPFEEHDVMDSTIEELALMQDGLFPGYTITEH